ncbi:SDR family oxidoreductase [Anoxybacillus rupiensis]|jgi:3-oxoacyl-[acyl-carrier protein] reductase|uniref:SDR family oxidoreductase n=1 Tax=Anoxybacteroides rupiense TaxID=311460 RepID=A0ABD5IRF3_9BACL|nr:MULTISPECIES: SDR family oxidoreductase [Anoxybacillus]KXG10617.1 3-oxoacyl-[acyl-carrier-protein] reductase FabG [Anoxybacillus sp. P3H1B]MBB3906099.1 3-oxoacyl-[acyl-carrier protein] reductase [Anoxybacillus rupiensis]MDE8563187.1 SDR family oxidoreductase [Anoxybacillus rupiensis]MED5050546.1 SDR family oxidoreductase [Anoxybacillus rupiensis]OQM46779.1 3-oxoacyl-ACP reductase [Anoxybacillus sp. UARK-01]
MKYALITGASGGIGASIAQELAAKGYGLFLHYHRHYENVQALQQQLSNVYTAAVQADLSRQDGVQTLLAQIDRPLDVMIHNCGISYYGLITDMSDELVQRMVQLHVTSPVLLTKKLLSPMIKKKHGNIIIISSIWGLTGASCEVVYSMVKGGQNAFVKALAKELAPSGIRVNAVAPGAIRTDMLEPFSETEIKELEEEIPLGRIGMPSEVAKTVSFLLSEDASYITGQVISVNGGWYC